MAYISINEEQFLKSASPAAATANDDKRKKKLYEALEEIAPETLKSAKKELEPYQPPSDDELSSAAMEAAEKKYGAKIADYLKKQSAKESKNQLKKDDAVSKSNDNIYDAEQKTYAGIKNAENSAIRKGIARSSIIDGVVKRYTEGLEDHKKNVNTALAETVAELEKELEMLKEEKKSALDNFETEKIESYETQIENLKKQREKQQKESTSNLQQAQKNYETQEKKFLEDIKNPELKQRAQAVLAFYKDATPQDAFSDFEKDAQLKKYLGAYYDILYSLLLSRSR